MAERTRSLCRDVSLVGRLGLKNSASAFVPKTLATITQTLERTIFNADSARLPGLLQGLDPRAKVLSAVLLLLAIAVSRHLVVILAAYALALLISRLSLLSLSTLFKGVWLGIPLFAAIIAAPAIFTTPGHVIWAIDLFNGLKLYFTDNGLSSAVLFVSRVGSSVSLVLIVVLTTRWGDILKALQVLRIPDVFIVILGMTYRYLFLLLHTLNGMFLARASRTVGRARGGEERRWVATATGVLVNKSFRMSEDVYLAMLSRGFVGEIRTLTEFRMLDKDWLALGLAVVVSAGLMLLDRGLG